MNQESNQQNCNSIINTVNQFQISEISKPEIHMTPEPKMIKKANKTIMKKH